jgi:signal transduction histidine kinase
MAEPDLVDSRLPLDRQNEKLRRITHALMDRVERDVYQAGNAFSLFQRAIALENEVQSRTEDLQRTLDELHRVNQKLEAASAVADEANRAKSRFLAAASHDVQQPLNAAKLFIDSLGRTGVTPEQRKILDQLGSAFRSVDGILGSLLDISRLDSAATRAEPVPFPVARLLDAIRNDFAPIAAERGLVLRIPHSRLWIDSDPFYLRQIVQNLTSNAIRYSQKGKVLIGCRRRANQLRIEVHDTGPGLREEDIPVIFEEFRQLRAKRTESQGVGLGLAIVDRACRLLDHPLDIRTFKDRGSCFTVSVPIATPNPTLTGRDGAPETDSAEATIVLMITEDTSLIDSINGYLDQWGMGSIAARSFDEAITIIDQLGVVPDAVLIDMDVSETDETEEFFARIGSAPRMIHIAQRSRGRLAAFGQRGPFAVLEKPVRPHRLRAALV